jgi:hypothetical protein
MPQPRRWGFTFGSVIGLTLDLLKDNNSREIAPALTSAGSYRVSTACRHGILRPHQIDLNTKLCYYLVYYDRSDRTIRKNPHWHR